MFLLLTLRSRPIDVVVTKLTSPTSTTSTSISRTRTIFRHLLFLPSLHLVVIVRKRHGINFDRRVAPHTCHEFLHAALQLNGVLVFAEDSLQVLARFLLEGGLVALHQRLDRSGPPALAVALACRGQRDELGLRSSARERLDILDEPLDDWRLVIRGNRRIFPSRHRPRRVKNKSWSRI